MNNAYLQHHGVKGMKWGVRRYRNKDGSLTDAGRKHASDYNEHLKLRSKVREESKRLIKSDSRLKKDFGDGVDDIEFLEIVADEYGIDTKKLRTAYTNERTFYRDYRDSIKKGEKIVKAYSSEIIPDVEKYLAEHYKPE